MNYLSEKKESGVYMFPTCTLITVLAQEAKRKLAISARLVYIPRTLLYEYLVLTVPVLQFFIIPLWVVPWQLKYADNDTRTLIHYL